MEPAEKETLLRWLSSAQYQFRHTGWHPVPFWIGRPASLCCKEENGTLNAALLASPDRLGVTWLHVVAASDPPGVRAAWRKLWPAARNILAGMRLSSVWAMTTLSWLIELLKEDGFSERGRVIAYSRPTLGRTPRSRNPDFITPMSKPDLPAVERLDHAAFAPPWQMDSDALQATFHRSVVSILYHTQNRLSGYLMATATPQGIHITRVAVHPDEQRKGIGRAMILHLLDVGYRRGAPRITVNTQTENQRSRQLYGSLGFSEMRETYPVFHSDLPGG